MENSDKEEFVRKVCLKFGDVIDFTDVVYKNTTTRIEYYCREGHYNNRLPVSFNRSIYCIECNRISKQNIFIEKAKLIHGEKRYDYSLVNYFDYHTKVKLICPIHGVFEITPNNHIFGDKSGCSKCHGNKKFTQFEFVSNANSVHGTGTYDYSLAVYVNAHTKVKVICPIHGVFEVTPNSHVYSKSTCPKCSILKTANDKRLKLDEFIQNAVAVHGVDTYDYSAVEYINAHEYVKIYCPIHEEYFYQTPNSHITQKSGCPKCGNEIRGNSLKLTIKEFIFKSKQLHGENTYDYSLVTYVNNHTPLTLVCNIHNKQFDVKPCNHLSRLQGCPYCNRSSGEVSIRTVLDRLGVLYEPELTIDDCRNIRPLPFDFAIFDKDRYVKGFIEMQGLQHYKPVCFGGISKERAERNFITTQLTDDIKKQYCENNGIPLLRIHYKDSKNISTILSQFIRSLDDYLEPL